MRGQYSAIKRRETGLRLDATVASGLETFPAKKLGHALLLLGLAESPIVLQILHLDRSYLFFVFSLAWAMALYSFLEPPRRAIWLGLAIYILTSVIAVPLLLAWLGPEQEVGQTEPATHLLL